MPWLIIIHWDLFFKTGKKITDFTISATGEGNSEIDETYGINVQFEESSEEDDEDAYGEVSNYKTDIVLYSSN